MKGYRFFVLVMLKFGLFFPSQAQAEEQQQISNHGKSAVVMSLGSGIGLKYKYMLGETIALTGGIRYFDSTYDLDDLGDDYTSSSDSNTLGYLIELRKYTSQSDTRYFYDIELYYAENENESTSINQLTTGTITSIRNSTNETLGITLAFGLEHFLKRNLSVEARAGIRYSIDKRSTDTTVINTTSVNRDSSKTDVDSWGFPVIAIGITKYW
ncbi:hypothetical protein [Kaarinaea lacus]